MILCLTGGIHSVTGPASAAGIRAFNCWSALVLSSQARVEQSKERVLPKKNTSFIQKKGKMYVLSLYKHCYNMFPKKREKHILFWTQAE